MNEDKLININGIREDLYQAMQIGDITLSSKHSQELYDFMNYQDKEIEKLHSIIKIATEYIKEKYDFILGDETFLDHDERIDRKQITHILEILDKVEENKCK